MLMFYRPVLTVDLTVVEELAHLLANIASNCSICLLEDLWENVPMLQDHLKKIRNLITLGGEVGRFLIQRPASSEFLLLPALEEPGRLFNAVQENNTNKEVRE